MQYVSRKIFYKYHILQKFLKNVKMGDFAKKLRTESVDVNFKLLFIMPNRNFTLLYVFGVISLNNGPIYTI